MRRRLAKYAIPGPILAEWEQRFGGRLLPLQVRALEEYGLLDGASLLISAPTSSGKTFCGEMAIVRAAQERKKGIFLTPLKAVTEEKYRQFRDGYGRLGLRLVIGTRDHPEHDAAIESGRFDIAVMVYEKFNSLLVNSFDLLGQVGTLVVDELQMLEDEERGPQLELALTKLLFSRYRPQIVALSAVLGEATGLAQWLGCRLLLDNNRPVELRRGVVASGTFHYRCHNSGEIGREAFAEGEDRGQTLFENIKAVFDVGHQALVFLKSRQETVAAAAGFVDHAGLAPLAENEAWCASRLDDDEPSTLTEQLKRLLACGVAFHNADLTANQRAVIEEAARAGMIKVVFATTTLATGINLPAATVFIEAQKYCQKGYAGRPGLAPLSWAEYEGMSGRAGRTGWIEEATPGRAVLFAGSELEKSILWDYYIERHPMPLESHLAGLAPADIIVDLFGCDLIDHPDQVVEVLSRSYGLSRNQLQAKQKDDIYEELLDKGYLGREGDIWWATPLGKATALTGLSVAGADYLAGTFRALEPCDEGQIIYHALHAPEGQRIYLPGGSGARSRPRFSPFLSASSEENSLVRELTNLQRELMPDEYDRLRLTFLLTDWMVGKPALDIEKKYHLYLGTIEGVARQAAWLLSSAAAVIGAHDRHASFPRRLEEMAFSAAFGLPPELKEFHRELDGLLHRGELMALRGKGIAGMTDLAQAGGAVMQEVVSLEARRDMVEQRIQSIKEDDMQKLADGRSGSTTRPESIEIDGTLVRERYLIRINGRSIKLTGKSFKYLVSLVWSRLTKDNGWLYKEDLEFGFNQARYLYRLRQEIGRDFLPDWPLYENNRAGYYRLVADRERIRVNVDVLRGIPDHQIQQMARDLLPTAS